MISFPVQSIVFVSFVHVKITAAVELHSVNGSVRLLGMLLSLKLKTGASTANFMTVGDS